MEDTPEKKGKGLTIVLIILLLGFSAAIIVLYTKLSDTQKDAVEVQNILESQKQTLAEELTYLQGEFGTLQTDNDSIKSLASDQQEKIEKLLQVNASNVQKIKLYQKELGTLRDVLKGYISQVDSLNQKNKILVDENRQVRSQLAVARNETIRLSEEKQDLNTKIEQASVLTISDVRGAAINNKGKEIDRINRVEMLRACFDVRKNNIISSGEKTFYARFKDPDGNLMPHPDGITFTVQGETVNCSSVRRIMYENEDIEVCIFWTAGGSGLSSPGKYTVDIFVDGRMAGSGSFILRK